MDKSNRPVGREKKVGSGEVEVEKRGEGLSGTTGGPVGNKDGYSDKPVNSGYDGYSSGTKGITVPATGFSKVIIFLIIAGFVIYFLYNAFNHKPKDVAQHPSGSPIVFVDKGEYPVNTSVSSLARNKRTVLKGSGNDTVTIMVYMCGSDLESQDGTATSDLQEMLYSEFSDKVNIIVETGGAKKWQNKTISSQTNQRYRVTAKGLELLEDNIGRKSMVNPGTLSDFISFSKKNFSADRYFLILWDHGGGSLSGYGWDQFFPYDSMTLDEISTALKNGGCSFDMIGFDTCLMATLETATAVEPYADYLIASEETEPGVGWYYTGWLTAISKNTSIPTIDLGKKIIDDYIKDTSAKTPDDQATLSLIDLAEFKGAVPSSFTSFSTSTNQLIDEQKYQTVSDARANAKEFASSSQINQIDLINFAQNIGNPESKALAEIMRGCIKYNRCSSNMTNANGISIFFPYDRFTMVSPMLDQYNVIGVSDEYSKCIKSFASVAVGGQIASGGSNMLETLLHGPVANSEAPSTSGIIQQLINQFIAKGDFSSITGLIGNSLGWLDLNKIKSFLSFYQGNKIDKESLVITEKNGKRVLALSDEQWKLIQNMEQNVFIDDGKGFIDLGLDNIYEYNDDGDLIMEYDGTWLTLNGHIVSYYMISEDRHDEIYSIKGRIPAMLNNQLVDIMVVFDDQNPDGKVLGAQIIYHNSKETETVAKGLLDIKPGDKVDFLCDYYTYAGKYSDTFYLGKPYIATGNWKIENLSVGKKKYQMTYRLTDIYNNKYWTPSIGN
jgi:hypothetical protein